MTINSIEFLLFFVIVFFLYYFLLKEKTKAQNVLLLIASYVFYGIAEWKMIPLLLVATGCFYGLGILIGKYNKAASKQAALFSTLGACLGIAILLYFKYLNFFISSFSDLFSAIGLHTNWGTFNIIMPLGISFFTFKLISYVLEVYRQRIEPVTDIVAFATYIAFFPAIMAGPIDRANTFIPQLQAKRPFDYTLSVDGCRQILWGMFKKMVIADNIALTVDSAWDGMLGAPGINLVMASFFYTIQLYTDFSGYSDMAIGVGKLLGFRITKNFNYPFFGRNMVEFWRNWHISLTSWLTDYVFMPLNIQFRNWRKGGTILAIIIDFVLVGLWHGANWTYVLFGLYHGLLYIPLILSGAFAKRSKLTVTKWGLPSLKDFMGMVGTFVLVTFGNIFFRSDSIDQVWGFIGRIIENPLQFQIAGMGLRSAFPGLLSALGMFVMEWHSYKHQMDYGLKIIAKKPMLIWPVYIIMILAILLIGGYQEKFIYYNF